MANQDQALSLNEGNTEKVNLAITTNDPSPGTPLNLATVDEIEVFLKASKETPDGDASTWKGSITGGQVTITDAAAGECYVKIAAAGITTTKKWWRVDTVAGDERKTAGGGPVTVVDW